MKRLTLFLAIFLLAIGTANAALNDSVVSAWNCNEGSGTSVGDSAGPNTGTVNINGWTANAKLGAAACDVGGSYPVSIGSGTSASFGGDVTLSVWIKASLVGDTYIWDDTTGGSGGKNFVVYQYANGTTLFQTSEPAGADSTRLSNLTLNASTWYHIVFQRDGNDFRAYINDQPVASWTDAGFTGGNTTNDIYLGAGTPGPSSVFNGVFDSMVIWNRSITRAEITELYNGSAGMEYPYPASTTPTNVTATASDSYDASSLTNFTVRFTNSTIDWTFTTTNGTAVTNISSASPSLFNITWSSNEAGGYFNATTSNKNVTTGTVTKSLSQAYASFNCFELVTNTSLTCAQPGPLARKAGAYTDQINVTGYHPVDYSYSLSALDNETFNVSGFYDHKLNITAEDYTGSPLSNFTIFYNSSTLNGNESDGGSGSVQLELFQNDTYTIEIVENVPSGAERNNSIESTVITVPESSPATTQFYQFNLSYPSLTITVLDEDTGVLVPGNTTLTFTEGNSSFEKTVVNGSAVFNASNSIPSGTYDIQFENEDYSDRTYSLTYNRTYPQSLTAYLVNTSSPSVVFILEDRETRNVVEGATITVQRFVNGSLTTVNVLTSDITGRTSFDYLTDEQYRFQITHADYTSRNFTLDPILFSSYTILLDSPTSVGETEGDYSGIGYVFTSTTFTEQETNSLNATISDASGSLVEYGFNVTVDGVQLTSQTGTNAYGSVLTSSFAIPAVGYNESLILDYWYMKSDGIMHEFRASYSIEQVTAYSNQTWAGNRDIADSIPILDRALVVVLILLAVGALAYTFAGLVGSGVAVMMIMGFFSYTGFINPWVFAVPIIGLFFLIIGRSSQ